MSSPSIPFSGHSCHYLMTNNVIDVFLLSLSTSMSLSLFLSLICVCVCLSIWLFLEQMRENPQFKNFLISEITSQSCIYLHHYSQCVKRIHKFIMCYHTSAVGYLNYLQDFAIANHNPINTLAQNFLSTSEWNISRFLGEVKIIFLLLKEASYTFCTLMTWKCNH